jgi:hypothetical protein
MEYMKFLNLLQEASGHVATLKKCVKCGKIYEDKESVEEF